MLKIIKPKKGNRQPKTQRQLESASRALTKLLLTNNPMKNSEIAKKNADVRRGKPQDNPVLFKKGNQFGKLRKNTKISEEQKIKHSMKIIGRKHTEAHNLKIKINSSRYWEGKHRTDETRKKISANHRHYQSEEAKRKISNSLKGKIPKNLEVLHKNNRGKNHYAFGKHLSEEHKAKLRIATLKNPNCRKNWFKSNKIKEVKNE